MIIAAAQRDQTVIERRDLDAALNFLEEVEIKMPRVFSNMGKNPLNLDIETAMAIVFENPGIKFGDMLAKMKHSVRKDELAEVMDTLATMGLIVVQAVPGGVTYRAANLRGL